MNKVLLALLAGVVVGVLVAPDKGSETIKRLRNRVKDYADDAEDKAGDLVKKGKEAFQNGRAQMSEALD